MKKGFLFLFSIIILTSSVFGISLFTAQDISKNYLFENEMIDSFSQQAITCDKNLYFVIPIINSGQEISFFVPVNFESGEVFLSKDSSKNIELIKTGYLLKELSYSNSNNYLSPQLIDKLEKLINELNSKKSRMEGIIDSDHSYEIKQSVINSKNKITNLINSLTEIKVNLNSLLEKQQKFKYDPNCSQTKDLLSKFDSSFKGYTELTKKLLEYTLSVEDSVKIIVSDSSVEELEKRSIIDFVSVPNGLSSEINSIFNYLSSTSSFYISIKERLVGSVGENTIKIYADNLEYRDNFVQINSLLYDFDKDLPKYSNLNSAILQILNPEYKLYWKNQEAVDRLQENYSLIMEKYIKGKGTNLEKGRAGVIEVNRAKSDVISILEQGFTEYNSSIDNNIYFVVGGVVVLLIILSILFFRKKRKPKKSKDSFKEKKDFLDDNFF